MNTNPSYKNFGFKFQFRQIDYLEGTNTLPGHQWQSTLFSTSWQLEKSKRLQGACLPMALVAVAHTHFQLDLEEAYSN